MSIQEFAYTGKIIKDMIYYSEVVTLLKKFFQQRVIHYIAIS